MKKFMYLAAALLVLVGCNKNSQENKENAPENYGTISGKIELPVGPNKIAAPTGWESKTEAFTMQWEATDKIYIYNDSECEQLSLKSIDAQSGKATFEGNLLSNMTEYSVAYGYNPKATGVTTFDVPYVKDNYRPFADGTGEAFEFTIANFGPVIGLQLKGDGAFSKIEVVLSDKDNGTLATYTMTFSTALTLYATTATKVYFPLQANAKATSMAINFYKEENSADVLVSSKTTANVPEANKVTTFPMLTFHEAYEYVDLGLPSGLKWATINVGATAPEYYGDYFAWGETEPKEDYSESTYTYTDSPITLPADHDAAAANWRGNWRMPTKDEQVELINNCDTEWTTDYNGTGVAGYIFKSKAAGNNNSIFLPASSYRNGTSLDDVGTYGYYWPSSRSGGNSDYACDLFFFPNYVDVDSDLRYLGHSVRPVFPAN